MTLSRLTNGSNPNPTDSKFRHQMPLSGPVYLSRDVRSKDGTNSMVNEKYTADFELAVVLPHQKGN